MLASNLVPRCEGRQLWTLRRFRRLAASAVVIAVMGGALACARDDIRVAVRSTPSAQCAFVADGTAVVRFGFMDQTRWDFSLPLNAGTTTEYTQNHSGRRLVARIGIDDKAAHAWYTIEITDQGRPTVSKSEKLPLRPMKQP